MHRLCFAVSVAGLVTCASALAQAQQPDTLSALQRTGFALAHLKVDQRVRIRAGGVGLVEGWVVTSSPNLVTLRTDGSRIDVPAAGVDSLWVRGGSHAGTGALIGAVVAGTALFAAASGCGCGGEGGANVGGALLAAGAGGAFIGALIGAPFPKWQLRVPWVPPERQDRSPLFGSSSGGGVSQSSGAPR